MDGQNVALWPGEYRARIAKKDKQMTKRKLICPKCGDEMNHHADKLVYQANPEKSRMDSDLGGIIEETHACPGCGAVASRHPE